MELVVAFREEFATDVGGNHEFPHPFGTNAHRRTHKFRHVCCWHEHPRGDKWYIATEMGHLLHSIHDLFYSVGRVDCAVV